LKKSTKAFAALKKIFLRHTEVSCLAISVLVIVLCFGTALGNINTYSNNSDDAWRAKLISNLIRTKFSTQHYSHKKIDDSLSEAAFKLYLKQLDYQKRFLLQEDVKTLKAYADKIDDEINSGVIRLPDVAASILDKRIEQVRGIVNSQLDHGFDFNRQETIQTDPEKRDFSTNIEQLQDFWRKTLKYEVANQLLTYQELEDSATKKQDTASADELDNKTDSPQAKSDDGKDPLVKAIEKVRKNYNEIFDRMVTMKEQEQYDRYFDAFTRAFDPHSSYLPPVQKEDFDIHMKGSLEGIGARLQEVDGVIKVIDVIPGGAAARQGELDAEDIILKVGEANEEPVDIVGMRIRDAVELIRGKKGTTVTLTIKKPDGRVKVVSIVRDVVNIEETFVKYTVLDTPKDGRLGYILIPTFYRDFSSAGQGDAGRNATEDVRKALVALKKEKIDGLILDLRNNGGGALIDAVEIAGLFIKQGPVVQIKEDNGAIQLREDEDPSIYYTGPMIVLVNEFSASASEILAGALQDYGRALIVGSKHTHGKGTVQAFIDLDRSLLWPSMQKYMPLGALKVTIQKFYRITGQSTQAMGVVPDIVLPDRMDYMKYGEKYIDYALPWDTIAPTDYSPVGSFANQLDYLRSQSAQRVNASKKFQDIVETSEKAKERRDNSSRSLTLAAIKQERDEFKKEKDEAEGEGDLNLEELHSHSGKNLTEKERQAAWEKKVKEDPYVGEAESVLADLKSGTGLLKASADK